MLPKMFEGWSVLFVVQVCFHIIIIIILYFASSAVRVTKSVLNDDIKMDWLTVGKQWVV